MENFEGRMKDQENEIDLILENLADSMIEIKTAPPIMTDDPFDFYVQRVQSGLFSKSDLFRAQVIKGYHVLMNQLKKN